ncbi:zinc finger protein 862-like [Oculina patagonica]
MFNLPLSSVLFRKMVIYLSESSSLDSEISQPNISTEGNTVPSPNSKESVADVVKSKETNERSQTSNGVCDHDSVLNLFSRSEIVHNYYTCNKSNCFGLTEKEQERNAALKRDRFKHQWVSDRNLAYDSCTGIWWLIYKEEADSEKGGMFCLLCKKHNTANTKNNSKVYNLIPAQRLKTDALKDHAKSAQHAAAVEAEMLSRVSVFQKEVEEQGKSRDEVLRNAFMSVYWLAKEEMANKKFLSLLNLLQMLGLENMKHFRHRSAGSTIEIFLTLGRVLKLKVVEALQKAKAFGLLVDEVTDIAVMEQLLAFVQYVSDDGEAVVKFLFVDNVLETSSSANAETITKCITDNLDKCELDILKLMSLVSDGAKVMTGPKGGVAARLKQLNSKLINVHCICHKLALACAGASDETKYIAQVEGVLFQLWKFFAKSPKRTAVLVKAQESWRKMNLSEKARSVVAKKVRKACRTRWLSTSNAVDGVYEDFVPIGQAVNVIDDKDGMVSYLLSQMKNFKFIGTIYILKAVLPELAALSRVFQRGTVNFGHVLPAITYTTDKLTKIAQDETPITQLQIDVQENGRLGTCGFKTNDRDIQVLRNLLKKYIQALKENIDSRFKDSMPVISAFAIFNPNAIPNRGTSEFSSYGLKEMATLSMHYFQDDEEAQQQVKAEWEKLKYDLLLWKEQIPQDLGNVTPTEWSLKRLLSMRTEYGHFYPKLVWIAEIIISLPMSNAWPERGASAVKRVKSRLRSSITNQMLEALLHITINGPPVSEAQGLIKESVETWNKAKKRRKLPPRASLGAVASGNSQSEVQAAVLVDSAVQTEDAEEASVQAEVEAAVEVFKLPVVDDGGSYDSDDSAFESEDEY